MKYYGYWNNAIKTQRRAIVETSLARLTQQMRRIAQRRANLMRSKITWRICIRADENIPVADGYEETLIASGIKRPKRYRVL